MSKYMTKQRMLLLDYLQAHPDEPMSAGQISEAVEDAPVSASAVYRNLAELEADGKVRRLSRAGSREVFFQYMDALDCRNCLHLNCTKCGKTFHMSTPGTDRVVRDVERSDFFRVDKSETVLYGVCRACRK